MAKKLSIIIVTYNSAAIVASCIKNFDHNDLAIFVVDNASSDNTIEAAKLVSNNVEVIALKQNSGYGRAVNIGLHQVKTDYAMVINPDVICDTESLLSLAELTRVTNDIAVSGPLVYHYNENGKQGLEMPGMESLDLTSKINYVPHVLGATMLFNMEILRKVDFFDENIFMFYEDDEICSRIKKSGYKMAIFSDVAFGHLCGKSSTPNAKIENLKAWHLSWSKLYYRKKHFGTLKMLRLGILFLPRFIFKIVASLLTLNTKEANTNFARLRGALLYMLGFSAFGSKGNPRR